MHISQKYYTGSRRQKLTLLLSCAVCLLAAALLGVCLGTNPIGLPELARALLQRDPADTAWRIIAHVRIPRVLGAVLAGGALAVSGATIQSVLDNPMASPNIIGVNAGAGFFVLLASSLFPAAAFALPLAAFAGALLATLLVLCIALCTGQSRLTLILAGFAVSAIFTAGMNAVLIFDPDAYVGAGGFLAGGLSAVTLSDLRWPAAYILVALVLALCCAGGMNILALGPDTAKALGMNVAFCRFLFLLLAAALAGAAVSFAGLIGFVGLVVPHSIRFFVGSDNRVLLPACALCGGAFVTLCDLLARVLFAPYEMPVGILMALFGGPFFIFLIVHNRRVIHD